MTENKRMETGVFQPENDWPGIFIRGDEALALARDIRAYLQNHSAFDASKLASLAGLLDSCRAVKIVACAAVHHDDPVRCELQKGHKGKHLGGMYIWADTPEATEPLSDPTA